MTTTTTVYLIRDRETAEFLKVCPKNEESIELEINEFNPNVFVTESKPLAEKLCQSSSHYSTIEDIAGYHISAPLDKIWNYDESVNIKFSQRNLEVFELIVTML